MYFLLCRCASYLPNLLAYFSLNQLTVELVDATNSGVEIARMIRSVQMMNLEVNQKIASWVVLVLLIMIDSQWVEETVFDSAVEKIVRLQF